MESQRVAMHGFGLQDAVHLVATLEQLIWDSEATLLEQVYHRQMRPVRDQISRTGLSKILQEYMMKWILGEQITPAVTLAPEQPEGPGGCLPEVVYDRRFP